MRRTLADNDPHEPPALGQDRRNQRRVGPGEYARRRALLHDDPDIDVVDMATLVGVAKAIEDEAKKQKFIDPSDAINGVDRSKLVYDQDDEDPTDIDIDLTSVVAEVKRLAASKPHFITRGTDDGEPSGSGFGGSKKQKKSSEDQMRELYPSL